MGKKYYVLIVDDQKDNRLFLKKIVESRKYEVIEAENGKAALDFAMTMAPDLIISDILMPVMDGYKFCIEVKKVDKLKNVPFIFYTATYTKKKDEEFALSLGAVRFLVKPEQPEVLITVIESYIKEFENGVFHESQKPIEGETETFKLYSEVLVIKLEQKMLELEKEVAEREFDRIELQKYRDGHEVLVKQRTEELEKKNAELQRFNKLFVDREFRIKELKDRIKELEEK